MKVVAKNDDVKRVIYHPAAGRFREDGTAEWPDDSYTHRRIADGDITAESSEPDKPAPKSRAKE